MSVYLKHRIGRGNQPNPSSSIETSVQSPSVVELPNRALSSANGVRKSSPTIEDLPTKDKMKKFEDLQKSLENLKINEMKVQQKGRPKKKPLSIKI